jgi:hypothetical protein
MTIIATNIADVTSFNVEFDTSNGVNIYVEINGEENLIAFAIRNKVGKGYRLVALNVGEEVFGDFRRQAGLFEWFDIHDGLSLAEVKRRGAILAGLHFAHVTSK